MAKWWDNGDDKYRRLIHSRKWRELRKRKLTAAIWCEDCAKDGRRELATEVHHEVPIIHGRTMSQMATLAYDYNNLRALCHACHCRRHEHRPTQAEQAQESAERAKNGFVSRFFGEG